MTACLESLKVVDEDIWKPELVDQLQVDRNHRLVGAAGGVEVGQEPLGDMKAGLRPHHVEIGAELHTVLLIYDHA